MIAESCSTQAFDDSSYSGATFAQLRLCVGSMVDLQCCKVSSRTKVTAQVCMR
jgi:hypothetical protein